MNYIKHLNQWMELVSVDDRLTPHHISIYLALFQLWNKSRFPDSLIICRNEIMQVAKVGSTRTYYKCINQLHEFGYIVYTPSKCPMKGSRVSLNLLDDISVDIDNTSTENEDDRDEESSFTSPSGTHVRHEQKGNITRCKNDTSRDPVVTPLYINNINLLNSKQRERRAHANIDLNSFSFLNQKEKSVREIKSPMEEKNSDDLQKSNPVSCASSGNNLERKIIVSHDNPIPTLDQVKDFFIHQLSGNYLNGVLEAKDREREAEKFFNHYESNGWLLGGKVHMRNWKASCRSWMAKIPYFSRNEARRSSFNRLHAKPVMDYAKPL